MHRLAVAAVSVALAALSPVMPVLPADAFERATLAARVDSERLIQFDIYLPVPNRAERDRLLARLVDPASSDYHRWLAPAQFDARFGPDPTTVARITSELGARGLSVVAVHGHGLTVAGQASAIEAAFSTRLRVAQFAHNRNRVAAERALALTPTLVAAGAVIPTFDPMIRMHRHSRIGPRLPAGTALPNNRYGSFGGYWFDDLKQAYAYPSYRALNGATPTGGSYYAGVLMEYGFNRSDMSAYFSHEGLTTPSFTDIPVDGGAAYDPNQSTETHLDLQQLGGMAPRAAVLLYDVPDLTDASVFTALQTILDSNRVNVVSMSFGTPEVEYLPSYNDGQDDRAYLGMYNDLFAQGNAQGITFVASSGDYGSNPAPAAACFAVDARPGCGGFIRSVEIPASSPNVTAVGGTTDLETWRQAGTLNSGYRAEQSYGDPVTTVSDTGTPAKGTQWASGGGVSIYFPRPAFQTLVNTHSQLRAVPDVAMHMGGLGAIGCPPPDAVRPCAADRSSDVLWIDGVQTAVIGTSAAAPDIAGLLMLRVSATHERWGNINPVLYQLAAKQARHEIAAAFRQGMPGGNGAYAAGAAYNYVTGLGTPDGILFMGIGAPPVPAGTPQNPSNP